MPRGVPKNKTTKRKILHRLKIARGHLDKVISMTENEDYCIDIVQQSFAVQSALKEADLVILENHMKTCVARAMKNGESGGIINEMIKVLDQRK